MKIILSIRSTFGGGKTTAVREFLNGYPSEELRGRDGKIRGYRVDARAAGIEQPVYVIGKYDNVCGGCDAIPTQQEAANRILAAHPHGHVLFEGALVSASGVNGTVTQAIHPTGADCYAFLDTPLEVCIERVLGRRAAAGNTKEFNPKNLIHKFDSVVSTYKTLRRENYDARLIDHTRVHEQLCAIIREYEAK